MLRLMTLHDLAEGFSTDSVDAALCVGADLAGDGTDFTSPQLAADLIDRTSPAVGADLRPESGPGDDFFTFG